MGKIQIDTDMLIVALEDQSSETNYYLDVKTGEIVVLTDFDIPEEDKYVYIDPIDSHESFRTMERFVDQLSEGRIKDDLSDALTRRKPFRQFKDTLHNYSDIREKWFLYHSQELKKTAHQWLQNMDIDADLLPLIEERKSKKREKRKYILSKMQIECLSSALELMYDEIKNDIATLVKTENAMEDLWLWNQLPPIGRAHLDLNMTFKLLISLITLVYKFHSEKNFKLGNRAEELLLHIAIENASGIAELYQDEIEDYNDFAIHTYEDFDFLMMYEQKFDGFDESPQGEMMGIGSLSPKDWFKTYNWPRKPHPFFWDQKDRLRFPANREITKDM
jgi:hypothetical protein